MEWKNAYKERSLDNLISKISGRERTGGQIMFIRNEVSTCL